MEPRLRRLLVQVLLAFTVTPLAPGLGAFAGDAPDDQGGPPWVTQTEVRGPIRIDGHDGFTRQNGVRGGVGTSADPYIVSNWTIPILEQPTAIQITNTTAHVVVENVLVPAYTGFIPSLLEGRIAAALEFVTVANLTVRNVWVTNGAVGVTVRDGENVVLRDLVLGRPSSGLVAQMGLGVEIVGSTDIRMQDTHVEGATWMVNVAASENVSLVGNRLHGNTGTCTRQGDRVECRGLSSAFVDRSVNVTVHGNIVDRVGVWLSRSGGRSVFVDNVIRDHLEGVIIEMTGDQGVVDVCGNTFEGVRGDMMGTSEVALWIVGGGGTVSQNTFRGNDRGLVLASSPGIRVDENRFYDHRHAAVEVYRSEDVRLSTNAFDNNTAGLVAYSDLDARQNWWGDASGPSGDGPGDGDAVWTHDHDVRLEPWLDMQPSFDHDCTST